MATRIYLPSSGAPSVSPAFWGSWSATGEADRIAAVLTKGATALANKTITEAVEEATTYVLARQYVTPALAADYSFTAGVDTWSVVARMMESEAGMNAYDYVAMRVLTGDGPAFRGTLYTGRPVAVELDVGALESRGASGLAVANVAALAGDRLVIEFGFRLDSNDATSRTATYNFGDAPASALDVGNTDADEDYPFVEFTGDISFVGGVVDYEYSGTIPVSVTPTYAIIRDYAPTGLIPAGMYPSIVSDPAYEPVEGEPEVPTVSRPWYSQPGRSAKWKH